MPLLGTCTMLTLAKINSNNFKEMSLTKTNIRLNTFLASWISIIYLSSPDHQKLVVLSCPLGFGVDIRDYIITGNL